MYGFGKREIEIAAPVEGKILDIAAVSDAYFANRELGDGFAVIPETDKILAPCDGTIVVASKTGHAVAMRHCGIEIVIQAGIGTSKFHGRGMRCCVKVGQNVKKGMPIIEFDRKLLQTYGFDPTIILVLANQGSSGIRVEKDLRNPEAVLRIRTRS